MTHLLTNTSRPIKVGDRVICIDAAASFQRLAEGATYTVEADYNGAPTVVVRGSYHSLDRFELAGAA